MPAPRNPHRFREQHGPRPCPSQLPDTFPPDRRCVEPGCITVLSIYNPGGWGPWCFRHLASHEHQELTEQQDRCLQIAA